MLKSDLFDWIYLSEPTKYYFLFRIMPSITRILIGLAINMEMWLMLFLNVIVLTCIIRGRLYSNKENPVYLISAFNMAGQTVQLLLHVFYVGPAIISGSWLFEGQSSIGVTIIATCFLGLWYLGSLIQIMMATNRLAVVCFPSITLFTQKRLIIGILFCFSAAACMVVYSQLLSPCCRITPDPTVFSYSYLVFPNQTTNPSMYFVDLPLDTSTSIICIISYILLFLYLIKIGNSGGRTHRKELKVCIQFLLMFLTYTVTWMTFFLYPAIGISAPEAFTVTTMVFMLDCGINSIIYITMNKEIRREINKQIGGKWFSSSTGILSNIIKSNSVNPPSHLST